MKAKRAVARCAAILLGSAAACPLLPTGVHAAPSVCNQPSVSGVSPQYASPGATVAVNGTTLDGTAIDHCTVSVTVGGTSLPVTSHSQNAIQFHLSSVANGPVVVTLTDPINNANVSNGNLVFVTTPTVGQLPAAPNVGQAMNVGASNLTMGGSLKSAAVAYATQSGQCPAPALGTSDTQLTVAALGQYCKAAATLSLTAFTTTDHGGSAPTVTLPLFPLGSVNVAPAVSGLSATHAPAGSVVHVTGSGFGTGGNATVGGIVASSSWTDTSVGISIPNTAHNGSAVALTRADGTTLAGGTINVDARVDSISPASAPIGAAVTISGGGLGSSGSVALGSASFTVTSWSPTSITATIPSGAVSGPLTIAPTDTGPPATAPALTIVPHITGITPTSAPAGSLVEIDGTTLGVQQGTVSVSGQAASVTLWGDNQILAVLPAGLSPGHATVSVAVPGAPAPLSIGLNVEPAITPGSNPTGSSTPNGGPTPGGPTPPPITPDPNGPIVKPGASIPFEKPKPSGPVDLSLATPQDAAEPGSELAFTVTLTAFGKPIVGAPVELVMVVEPGTDAILTPLKGVTDAEGKLAGTLHLSATPGDHIVLARSGQYSDEVRVVGRAGGQSAATAGDDASSGPLSQRMLIIGALILCLVLFLGGFAIQLRTTSGRSQPRPGSMAGKARRRNPLDAVTGFSLGVAAMLQFLVAMAVAVTGRLVATVRRA